MEWRHYQHHICKLNNIMKKIWIAPLLIFFVACGEEKAGSYAEYELAETPMSEKVEAGSADLRFDEGKPDAARGSVTLAFNGAVSNQLAALEPQKTERKLIYQANLSLEVEDQQKAYAGVQQLVAKHGGYISEDQLQTATYNIHRSLVIRVPVEHYNTLLNNLEGVAVKVLEKQSYANDVTEEWVDIEARLKTKRAVEARYLDILNKAKTIEDILKVENQLRVIREEIESREGLLKYLKDQVAISTIRLSMDQPVPYEYTPEERPGFFARLLTSLDKGWSGLLGFILGVATIWPFWIILALVGYGIRRLIKRSKAQKKATE